MSSTNEHDCQWRQHSVILNKVAWRIHEAMGVIPEGVASYVGDVEADLDRACELIRLGRSAEAMTPDEQRDIKDMCADVSFGAQAMFDHLVANGMVVLGPDGEPLDVRPALRAVGREAWAYGRPRDRSVGPETEKRRAWSFLELHMLGPELVDACLAAAEVEP